MTNFKHTKIYEEGSETIEQSHNTTIQDIIDTIKRNGGIIGWIDQYHITHPFDISKAT